MKIRIGFVSNSSSSSFVIKKTDIDLNDLKKFMHDNKVDENYIIMNDEDYVIKDNDPKIQDHIWLSTQSYGEYYDEAHLKLLVYLRDHNIKEVTGDGNNTGIGYRGDGRFEPEEEIVMLKIYDECKDYDKAVHEFNNTR